MDHQHLYKYRSLDGKDFDYTRQILVENVLWFSRPSDFNDPFDCRPAVSTAATAAENKEWIDDLFKKKAPPMPRSERRLLKKSAKRQLAQSGRSGDVAWFDTVVGKIVNQAGVLSLSARCDHVLMWSHYTSAHRGVCIRFKAKRTTPFFGRAQQVSYSDARPVLNLVRDVEGDGSELARKTLLTKADFWSYEQEWRIIEHDLGPGLHRFDPAELLDGVILGANIRPDHKSKILEWVESRWMKIAVFEARVDATYFRLNVVPLNDAAAAEISD